MLVSGLVALILKLDTGLDTRKADNKSLKGILPFHSSLLSLVRSLGLIIFARRYLHVHKLSTTILFEPLNNFNFVIVNEHTETGISFCEVRQVA